NLMDENVKEIREEYDEKKENEWRKVHRENVRKYHQEKAKARAEGRGDTEFQEIMSRLDELELEEDYGHKYKPRMKSMPNVPQPESPVVSTSSKEPPKPA